MDWDDIRYFLALAREGTLSSASKILFVNVSTVSRRIDSFEKKISVRLFERLPTGYNLTSAGLEMKNSAERIESEIASLNRNIAGQDNQLKGKFRLTLPATLATHLLMPDFSQFCNDHPNINMIISVSSDIIDMTKREADIAIRITNNPPDHLVGRCLSKISKAIYASEDYLANHDYLNYPANLQWIGWEDNELIPKWVKDSWFPETPIHHHTNDLQVQFEAAKCGMGISVLPCFIADQEPSLKRIAPYTSGNYSELWILTHKDLISSARVKAFMNFMVKAIEKHKKVLVGNIINSKEEELI